ncbi:hypothetical protein ABG79_00958 [Caloramator mitchellensis]|uniref:DUF8052 domain-containing protein n=1 Tax=Caloramator mitchellensis TaxID=908809 RepID=A0A0R3JUH4_CALMK|nr:hypothetical protein [Caloramator mitchellensis]KRQ87160.1 hypothetical protein ABG79_00958 [Caloramator mitchellensis]
MEIQNYLSNIEKILEKHFDIEKNVELSGFNCDLFAKYRVINQRTFLTKKDVIDRYENNEFIFIKQANNWDLVEVEHFTKELIRISNLLIKPNRYHMSTAITGVILTEKSNQAIQQFVEKFKYNKSYMFYLHGWSEIRLLLVDLVNMRVYTNKAGKGVKKVFETPNK